MERLFGLMHNRVATTIQRLKAIQLIEKGGTVWSPTRIFKDVFKRVYKSESSQRFYANNHFIENLFPEFQDPNLSKQGIIDLIYTHYSKGTQETLIDRNKLDSWL